MARETIILTRNDVARQIDLAEVIPAIERCLAEFEKGQDLLPPKYIVEFEEGIAACVFGYTHATRVLSMKLGQERPQNLERGLPSTTSTIDLFDPDVGDLLMIVDGVLPTMYRTAAAATVAVRHLARDDAETAAVIGAGQLGRECIRALSIVRPFGKIFVYDVREEQAHQVVQSLSQELSVPLETAGVEQACRQADIICTATNSTQTIVQDAWIRPGTHLSCMGADLAAKRECQMSLLPRCRLFADLVDHCLQRGEVSQAIEQGRLGSDCFAGSLGQVINGQVEGRRNRDEITLFDAVGLGVEDTTVTKSIYDQAQEKGLGLRVRING